MVVDRVANRLLVLEKREVGVVPCDVLQQHISASHAEQEHTLVITHLKKYEVTSSFSHLVF